MAIEATLASLENKGKEKENTSPPFFFFFFSSPSLHVLSPVPLFPPLPLILLLPLPLFPALLRMRKGVAGCVDITPRRAGGEKQGGEDELPRL